MYAIIETGGKQYRVQEGDVLDIELLEHDGDSISFENVLMVGGSGEPQIGTPTLEGASVKASVVGAVRAPKVLVYKKKRRKRYERLAGHRQNMLRVKIDSIAG